MKIEYLEGNQHPLPLVRLFDFDSEEIAALRHACDALADGRLHEFALHEQPWVCPVGGCRFIWRVSRNDVGVIALPSDKSLALEYSEEAWREVAGKLAQFAEPQPNTFNWLAMEGEVAVLISLDGQW